MSEELETPTPVGRRGSVTLCVLIGLGVGLGFALAVVLTMGAVLLLGLGPATGAGALSPYILFATFNVNPYLVPIAAAAAAFVARFGWARGLSAPRGSALALAASGVLAALLGWLAGLYAGIAATVIWAIVAARLGTTAGIELMGYGAVLGAVIGIALVLRSPRRREV